MPRRYGAIVVGAGPAGLALAARLGRLMSVALVEWRTIGWAKPCAGLLCDAAYGELLDLGLAGGYFGEPPALELAVTVRGATMAPQRFRSVDRPALGAALRGALPPSVEVYEGVAASLGRSGGLFAASLADRGSASRVEIDSPRLVAADGVGSSTRRFLGLPPVPTIGLVQLRFRADPSPSPGGGPGEATMILDPGLCDDYYCWVLPRAGRSLVGMKDDLGVMARTLRELRRRFPGRFEGEPESIERYAVSKPDDLSEVAVTGGGAFLVGEAAGLVSPSSGEGLSWAFSSARALAGAIEGAGAGGVGAELAAYEGAMREGIMRIGRDIARGTAWGPAAAAPR